MSSADERIDVLCLANSHGIGGAQLNAGLIASELAKLGLRTSIGFLFEREIESTHGHDDVFVIAPSAPRGPIKLASFLLSAHREIARRKPRFIIGFQPASNVIAAATAKLIPGCHVVATQRNPSAFQSRPGRIFDLVAGACGLYRANIAVSETVAGSFDSYPQSYRRRMTVVHNATPSLAASLDGKAASRAILGIEPHARVIGCVGRLHPQKNFIQAIRAHAQLQDDSQLYLAGTGPEEGSLREEAASLGTTERVHFLGSLSGENLTRFYRSLDIMLFTSRYEGFGRVLVEAMSEGVPVVSSDIPIAREVGGDAVIFCGDDLQEWKQRIIQVIDSPELRARLASAGRTRAAFFNTESMVNGYLQTLKQP